MRPIATASLSYCPNCGAPNLRHRRDCYICHTPLGAGHAPTPERWRNPALDNARRDPRFDVGPHSLMVQGDGIPRHEAHFRNVSANGVAILTTIPCPLNAVVRLEMLIDGHLYRTNGVVRHSTCGREETRTLYLVGIQFTSSIPPLSRLMEPAKAR